MKTLRSTFEENYRAVPEPCDNKRGFKMRYVYIGLWYIWNLPPERVRTAKRLIGTACLFSALLFFSGAFLNSPLNHDRYVSLTGMLSIAALVFEVFGTVQFCAAREKMTSMDFHDIQTKLMLAPPGPRNSAACHSCVCGLADASLGRLRSGRRCGSHVLRAVRPAIPVDVPLFPLHARSEGKEQGCGHRPVFLTNRRSP